MIAALCMLSIAMCLTASPAALAQDPTVPLPNILPPPPPPPPPPRIEVPKIPKMDEIPTSPRAALPRRKSFDARVRDCIDEGGIGGWGPNDRAAYTRGCVNR